MRHPILSGFIALAPKLLNLRSSRRIPTRHYTSKQDHVTPVTSSSLSSSSLSATVSARTDTKYEEDVIYQTQCQIMQDVLCRVRDVNRMPEDIRADLMDFCVDGQTLGRVLPPTANLLCAKHVLQDNRPVFQMVDVSSQGSNNIKKKALTFTDYVAPTFEARSEAVAQVTHALRDDQVVRGWRDELYPVSQSFYDPPVFAMERAAVPLLGALEYGVHINGLVQTNENDGGDVKMWMARRSPTKSKYPNMLDHIVAGGQPVGISLMDNVIKECLEEAGIPENITKAGIRSAGAISYETYNGPKTSTISRAVLFNYDLYLPQDFVPQPVDGEVQEFFLWTIDDLLASMSPDYPDPIKPNCYAVIIDYLVRQGHLNPDVPGYLDVVRELRSGDCR